MTTACPPRQADDAALETADRPRRLPAGTGSPSRLREAKHRAVVSAAVPFSRLLGPRDAEAFGILMYHRVTEAPASAEAPTWNVPPSQFRRQLGGLLALGYRPWPLQRVIEHCRERQPLPSKVFVVTFDDGYENVYREAWPILKELGVPATVFVATAYLDSPRPFPSDDWSEAGSFRVPAECWRPLTTTQCGEMLDSGLVELGTHTHRHADYRGRAEFLEQDLRTSLSALQRRFGIEQATFAFPYGTKHLGFSSPELSSAAQRAGVLCSLTTEAETVRPGDDPFDWGRFTAEAWDTPRTLAAKLDGWYGALRSVRQRIW